MNLQEFRSQYPEYDGVPDDELTRRLYAKHYATKMPWNDFHDKFVGAPPPDAAEPVAATPSRAADLGHDVESQTAQLASGVLEVPKLVASLGEDTEAPTTQQGLSKVWAGAKGMYHGLFTPTGVPMTDPTSDAKQAALTGEALGGAAKVVGGAGDTVRGITQDAFGGPVTQKLMWLNKKVYGGLGNSKPVVASQAWLNQKSDDAIAAMSPEYQMSIAKSAVDQDENGEYKPGTGLEDPMWWVHGGINMGVQMPLMLAPPAISARVSYGLAFRDALASNAVKNIPQSEAVAYATRQAEKAGVRSAMLTGGLTEGVFSGAQDAQQTEETINQIDEQTLLHYEPYRELREQGMTHEQARAVVARSKALAVGIGAATAVGLTGAPLNAWIGKWATVGMHAGRLKTALQGAGLEAGQEFVQGGAEQLIQNKAEQPIDQKDTWDQVLNQAVSGGLIAGVFGGAEGALAGHGGHMSEEQSKKAEAVQTARDAYNMAQQNLDTAESHARDPNVRLKYDDLVKARQDHQTATVGLAQAMLDSGHLDKKTQQTVAQALHDARAAGVEMPEETNEPGNAVAATPLSTEDKARHDALTAISRAEPVTAEQLHPLVAAGMVKVSTEGQPVLLPAGRRQQKALDAKVVAAEQQSGAEATEEPAAEASNPAAAEAQAQPSATLSAKKKRTPSPTISAAKAIEVMTDKIPTQDQLDQAEARIKTAEVGGTDTGHFREALQAAQQRKTDADASVAAGMHKNTINTALKLHNETGGFTVNPKTGKPQKSGWAFAPSKTTEKVFDHVPTPDEVSEYAKSQKAMLSKPNHFLGGWKDGARHVLDVSMVNEDQGKAEAAAARANQDAIFNLGTMKTVYAKDFAQPAVKAAASVRASVKATNDVRATSYNAATAKPFGMTEAQIKAEARAEKTGKPATAAQSKAQSRQALLDFLKLKPPGKTIRFRHFSPTKAAELELNPNRQGTGLTGAERERGGEKVTSFYSEHGKVEPELKNHNEYHADIPESDLYNASEDPLNLRAKSNVPVSFTLDDNGKMVPSKEEFDFNRYEKNIKKAGFKGYHMPEAKGILRGQARMFVKTKVTNTQIEKAALQNRASKKAKPTRTMQVDEALKHVAGLLTPKEKSTLHRATAKKLADIFAELPDDKEMAAVAIAGQAKRGWYERSSKAIVNVFGADAPRFAGLLAALSPQTSVEQNFKNAVAVFTAWDKAGRPQTRPEIVKVMKASVFPGNNRLGKYDVLPAWINNSVRALTSEDPDTVILSGPKVDSFAANLRGETNRVTLDAWMANFANVDQKLFSGALTKEGPGTRPGYLAFTARVRQAADRLTQMTGQNWTPAEVQETVWSWAKTLYEHADSYKGMATAKEILDSKELTDELINATPDFVTQFADPVAERILRDAGYGDRLDELTGKESAVGDGAEKVGALAGDSARLRRAAGRLDAVRARREQQAAENRVRESIVKNPTFFSRATQAAESLTMKSAPGAQWLATLKNQPSVKQEELDYMGLPEWLEGQDKVSKDDLLDFMRANELQISETMLGDAPVGFNEDSEAMSLLPKEKVQDLLDSGYEAGEIASALSYGTDPTIKEWRDNLFESNPEFKQRILSHGTSDMSSYIQRLVNKALKQGDVSGPPKYARYVTPGGTNYRELLITLPNTTQPSPEWEMANRELAHAETLLEAITERQADLIHKRTQTNIREEVDEINNQLRENVAQRDKAARAREIARDRLGEANEGQSYKSSHWDDRNIVAHVRMNERSDTDGKPVLFVEEVQSDWHQQGRKHGYENKDEREALQKAEDDAREKLKGLLETWFEKNDMAKANADAAIDDLNKTGPGQFTDERGIDSDSPLAEAIVDYTMAYRQRKNNRNFGIPDAPFKTTWPELAMKRVLRYAAENGFSRIAWTTGDMQAQRYALSRHIGSVQWMPHEGGTGTFVANDTGGNPAIAERNVKPERVGELVGKAVAKKLMETEPLDIGAIRERRRKAAENLNFEVTKFYQQMFEDNRVALEAKGEHTISAEDAIRYADSAAKVVMETKSHLKPADFYRYFNPQSAENLPASLKAAAEENYAAAQKYEGVGGHMNNADKVHTLEGLSMNIGGEGMRGFYDSILPTTMNKYLKKWGVKVGTSSVQTGRWYRVGKVGEKFRILTNNGDDGDDYVRTDDGHTETAIGNRYLNFKTVEEANAWVKEQKGPTVHSIDLTDKMQEAAFAGQPLFAVGRTDSVMDTKQMVQRLKDATAVADEINKSLGINLQVVAKQSHLPEADSYDDNTVLEGMYVADPDALLGGRIYLVAENLTSRWNATEVAAHEAVGHMGLRAMLGDKMGETMDALYQSFPHQTIAAAKRNDLNVNHSNPHVRLEMQRAAAEEMVAYAAGGLLSKNGVASERSTWEKIVSFVRNALRKISLLKSWSDSDLNDLIYRSRDYVRDFSKKHMRDRAVYTGNYNYAASKKGRPLGSAPGNQHLDSFLNKIGSDKETLGEKWKRFKSTAKDRIEMSVFDQFHGIVRAANLAGVSLGDAGYYNARLSSNSAELVQSMMEYGHPVWNGDAPDVAGGMGFLDILKPLGDKVNPWLAYMVARRAQRLAGEGRENLFTSDEINAALDLGKQNPEFDVVAEKYAAFQKKVLDFAQQAGIINPDSRALWENQDYIPFHRLVENGEVQQRASAGALGRIKNQIVQLKGGRANLGDPMENITRNWLALMDASLKAHAARNVVDGLNGTGLVSQSPIVNQVVPAHNIKSFVKSNPTLVASLKSVGVDVNKLTPQQLRGLQTQLAVPPPAEEGTISIWRDGKREHWAVHDDMLFQSLQGLKKSAWSPLMELLRAPKRLITATVTITPQFLLKNVWRDMWHTFIVGTHDGKTIVPLKDTIVGTIDSMKMDSTAQSMLAGGGSFAHGWIYGGDTAGGAAAIRRTLRAHHKGTGIILDTPLKAFRFYRKLQNASENANRVAIYRKSLKSGKARSEALYEARDIMDFSMQGASPVIQFLVQSVPFFNARLQGLYRIGRGITKKTALSIFMRGALLSVLSLAILARNWRDDRYKALSNDQKSNYWHLWDVFQKGDHWQIPKPFETGAVFGTMPEVIGDAFLTNADEPDRAQQAADLMLYTVGQQLNMSPQPAAIWPIVELATNKNSYTGAPILTEGDQGVLPEDQVGPNSSPTYREIAQHMPSFMPEALRSPKQLEFLARAYIGNVQDYALLASDLIARKINGEAAPPKATSNDWPGLRDFRKIGPATHTKYADTMYDIADQATKVYESRQKAINADTDEGDQRAQQIEDDNQQLLDVRSDFQKAAKQVGDLKKQQRQIQLDTNMDPDEKRSQIDELQEEINDTARDVYDLRPGGKLNPKDAAQLINATPQAQSKILRGAGLPATADLVNQSQSMQ